MIYYEKANIKGRQLSYIRCNDWSEDSILFFHGYIGSKEFFPKEDTLDKCILSFDRPGVGESSVVEYYAMEDFLVDVYEVLKTHKVSSVKLIGHSAGGYYAQLFSQMYPDIISSLSLISSVIPLNCPKTKGLVNNQWKFITLLSLRAKKFSRFYFKQMAKGITKHYDKQLTQNMKVLPKIEKQFMEENYELAKNAIIKAVANEGSGVCFDSFALCQKRDAPVISKNIPVYIWHGIEDTTIPISFIKYFEENYSIKQVHKIENAGHMLYLPYWNEIIKE